MPGTATRGRGRPRQEIDEQSLLDAALQTFAAEGFRGAGVELVAERAGVTKPLLFRRFRSKNGLFEWTVDREIAVLTEHLFTAYDRVEGVRLSDALHAGAEAIIAYATARPDGFRLLFQVGDVGTDAAPGVSEKVRAVLTDRMEAIVARRLEQGAIGEAGELAAGLLAAAIVGASEHVARRCVEEPRIDPAAAAQLLAAMLTRGLRDLRPADLHAVEQRKKTP